MKRNLAKILFTFIVIFSSPANLQAKPAKRTRADVSAAFDNDCDELLIDNIQKAKTTIYAAFYTFTHKDIAEALIKKARERVK